MGGCVGKGKLPQEDVESSPPLARKSKSNEDSTEIEPKTSEQTSEKPQQPPQPQPQPQEQPQIQPTQSQPQTQSQSQSQTPSQSQELPQDQSQQSVQVQTQSSPSPKLPKDESTASVNTKDFQDNQSFSAPILPSVSPRKQRPLSPRAHHEKKVTMNAAITVHERAPRGLTLKNSLEKKKDRSYSHLDQLKQKRRSLLVDDSLSTTGAPASRKTTTSGGDRKSKILDKLEKKDQPSELTFCRSNLKEFPFEEEVFANPSLQLLRLHFNQISIWPEENQLLNLSGLEQLDLSYNKITKIPQYITVLQGLSLLTLTGNAIEEWISPIPQGVSKEFNQSIPPEITGIHKLETLVHINISMCSLKSLPFPILQLPHLQELIMRSNELTSLPSELCDLKLLALLDVVDNQITHLPENIGMLECLEDIYLDNNQLSSLPESIGDIEELKMMSLLSNQLSSFPSSFSKLNKLRHIWLKGNNFSQISSKLFSQIDSKQTLIGLRDISLRKNRLVEFPDFGSCKPNIVLLDLSENMITTLPEFISEMVSLEELSLSGNQIREIPSGIGALLELTMLNLSFNELTELPDSISDLNRLTSFQISYNKIKSIPSLEGLDLLEELCISGNHLTSFPEGLDTLASLERCYASNNRITSLPDDESLYDLSSLKELDFSFNEISELPEVWTHLRRRLRLYLHHNNLPDEIQNIHPDHESLGYSNTKDHDLSVRERFFLGFSDLQGRRPHMEDAHCIASPLIPGQDIHLFTLYDGHAGTFVAHECSKQFPEILLKYINENSIDFINEPPIQRIEEILIELCSKLNESVLESMKMAPMIERGSGTTGIFALIFGDNLIVFNVGDSRGVICCSGNSKRVSYDQKPLNKEEQERIINLGGHVSVDGRINGNLAVSRTFGDFPFRPYVSCVPFISPLMKIDDKFEFLILACDGVWDEVEDEKAVKVIREFLQENENNNNNNDEGKVNSYREKVLSASASKLRDLAFCTGSDDNISILIIQFRH